MSSNTPEGNSKRYDLFKRIKASLAVKEAEKIAVEMYNLGVQYANDGIPWPEVEDSGYNNEPEFVRGYNETLEKLGKSR